MIRVLAIVLLLSVVLFAADSDVITLSNFSGLNTIDGDLVVSKEASRLANNVDFSKRGRRSISKRDGFVVADTGATAVDSIISLSVWNRADGNKRLVAVVADNDSGWGTIKMSSNNGQVLDTSLSIRWPITKKSSFVSWNGTLIGGSGSNIGMSFDGRRLTQFPIRHPAEPLIIPTTRKGPLTGDFYYFFNVTIGGGGPCHYDISKLSASSRMVHVDSQQVYIGGMLPIPPDTFGCNYDTLSLSIYRTYGSKIPQQLDDSCHLIAVKYFTSQAAMMAWSMYDSVPDDAATAKMDMFTENARSIIDSNYLYFDYGSARYVKADTIGSLYDTTGVSIRPNGWSIIYTVWDYETGDKRTILYV
jgi:hypothetical protein